jgi:hypothetical protein
MRFTDPRKWHDPSFRTLAPEQKLLFVYVWENCDNGGFIPYDDPAAAFYTGIDVEQISEIWEKLENKIVVKDGWIWVKEFPRLQKNWPLKLNNGAHKQVNRLLGEQYGRFKDCPEFTTFIAPPEGLPCPLGIGNGIGRSNGFGIGKGLGNGNGEGRGQGNGHGQTLTHINQELQERAAAQDDHSNPLQETDESDPF